MIDLTGGNLTAYLLREVSEVVGKHPRFRSSGGQVTFANNTIAIGNVQCTVKNISTQGTRLSPDYFLFTQYGYAILAKLGDKEGMFCEWVQEVDTTLLDPGVYCLNVDEVSEKRQEVLLTCQKYEWRQGKVLNAKGSQVYFAPQTTFGSPPFSVPINTSMLTVTDSALQPVSFVVYSNYIQITSPVFSPLIITLTYGSPAEQVVLRPFTDFWYQQYSTVVVKQTTTFGKQLVLVPETFISFTLTDQDGYTLVPYKDFIYPPRSVTIPNPTVVELADFTPAGFTISANGVMKVDPRLASVVAAENIIPITLKPGQKLVPDQVFIRTDQGDIAPDQLITNADGSIQLPIVLGPGDCYSWEVRIDCGLTEGIIAKKNFVNRLQKVVHDQNGKELSRTDVAPGLWVAIGDRVEIGDQIAIIVSPTRTECYQVFGSKENLTFTLDVKANDLLTASELSELIKAEWTYRNRDSMEADGITIFEISREQTGEARDSSGTAPSYTYSLNVTAACDWKGFVPLVTRLTQIDIIDSAGNQPLFGNITYPARLQSLGAKQWVAGLGD